jgi:hypothetical protein
MKKFTILFLLVVTATSFAQIKKVEQVKSNSVEIGKIQPLGQPVHMSIEKDGDIYSFIYKDEEFKHILQYESFIFKDVDNAYASFYDMIIKGFEEMPAEPIKLELEHQFVWLKFSKQLGIKLITFSSTNDKSTGARVTSSKDFNKKQIEKLFGKK